MQGRLESKLKREKNIENLLKEMPSFVEDYYYSISSKESSTCLEYLRKLKVFLKFLNEDMSKIELNQITEVDIARYFKSLEVKYDNGESSETSFAYRKQAYSILNSFFTIMFRKRFISSNPVDLIDRPRKVDKVNRYFLSKEELEAILDSVSYGAGNELSKSKQYLWQSRDKAILSLFIHTGIRETALLEINIEDIDLIHNTLSVTDKGHKKHNYKINNTLREAIVKWMDDRLNLLKGFPDEDALFISSERKRMSRNAVVKVVEKYSKEALGVSYSPHKLRAALCNILLQESNGDIYFVSKAIGHSDVKTTKLYVADDTETHREKASQIMENLFS